jgi:hypothetical protein
MGKSMNLDGNYHIEVSGWDSDSNFFVEPTELFWDRSGDKRVLLQHAPAEGSIVFIRLLLSVPAGNILPVAYQVAAVHPMDCNGQSEIRLKRLHPHTKVPQTADLASNLLEDCKKTYAPKEKSAHVEQEEILQ